MKRILGWNGRKLKPSGLRLWKSAISEFQPFALGEYRGGKEKRLRYINRSGHLFSEVGSRAGIGFPGDNRCVVAERMWSRIALSKGAWRRGHAACCFWRPREMLFCRFRRFPKCTSIRNWGSFFIWWTGLFPSTSARNGCRQNTLRLLKVLEQLYAKKQVDAVKEIRMDYLDDKVLVTGVQIDG